MPSISVSFSLLSLDHRRQRLGIVADRPRRVAIGPHAKRIGALEVEDVADQVEGVGDVGVGHGSEVKVKEVQGSI